MALALAIGALTASPARADVAQPDKGLFIFITMAPSALAIASIAINAVELSDGNGSPTGWVAFGIIGGLVAFAGSAIGYASIDSAASGDEPYVAAAAIASTAIGIAAFTLTIIGADQYSSDAESDDLALYLAPDVALTEGRAGLVLGGAL